ncbi:hypothetical protein HDU99_009061, partial [Rhizoclosmatium hyalinum]
MAIGTTHMYSGIQNKMILFSIWEVGGKNPDVISKHKDATCKDFGGEGTGIQCAIPFAPQIDATYTFVMSVVPAGNLQDYAVQMTDQSSGQTYEIATMRLQTSQENLGAYSFTEDWATYNSSCLQTDQRHVTVQNVKYFKNGQWNLVDPSLVYGDAVFTPNHNEVCTNYDFNFADGKYWMSNGGMSIGTPLNIPGRSRNYYAPPPSPSSTTSASSSTIIPTSSTVIPNVSTTVKAPLASSTNVVSSAVDKGITTAAVTVPGATSVANVPPATVSSTSSSVAVTVPSSSPLPNAPPAVVAST